jgi:hypothetical protein
MSAGKSFDGTSVYLLGSINRLRQAVTHQVHYGCELQFGWLQASQNLLKGKKIVVAAGGFEPPTFGL